MFDVGDEIVCIDDTPGETYIGQTAYRRPGPLPIRKGEVYVVQAVFLPGYRDANFVCTKPAVAVGVDDPDWYDFMESITGRRPIVSTRDLWIVERFRKVVKPMNRTELYNRMNIGHLLDVKHKELV